MIHGSVHSSDECKVLRNFGTKYAAAQPAKDRGSDPVPRKVFHKNKRTTLLLITWWMKSTRLNPKGQCRQSRGTRMFGKQLRLEGPVSYGKYEP